MYGITWHKNIKLYKHHTKNFLSSLGKKALINSREIKKATAIIVTIHNAAKMKFPHIGKNVAYPTFVSSQLIPGWRGSEKTTKTK